ncbi:MAG: arylsulfatase [Chlorobi bacterium]|nr:arylsulfatase [Chlorobiota bacterium]
MKIILVILAVLTFTVSACSGSETGKSKKEVKPNIVVIYFDDLGYGDAGAYGSKAIPTPNIDKLAKGGMRFTRGYSSSSTCTPSRYALLTGKYPWRNKKAHILPGSAPLIIGTDELTIPKMLKKQGYQTGIVGKWHLGLGSGNVDWNRHISPGPNEVGFDYSFIMAATQDRVPTVYIENGNVLRLDKSDPIEVSYRKKFPGELTGKEHPELLKLKPSPGQGHTGTIVNGISRIGHMIGGESARWVDENMADTFVVRAKSYIKTHKDKPFFLYFALQQPHVPRTPNKRFVGKTDLGPRGDVIVEGDWCVGEIMKTLENEGLLENTLIVLTSDNGPVLDDGYQDESVERNGDHKPWGPFRGGKYSLLEAGTRLPFITFWKGHIEPGVSDAMVSQIDLLNSFASLVGSDERSKDGVDIMDVFLGKSNAGRESLGIEATGRTAYRKGNWVMIPPYKGPSVNWVNLPTGNAPVVQLYNLKTDIRQEKNVAEENPEILNEMISEYEKLTGKKVKMKLETEK